MSKKTTGVTAMFQYYQTELLLFGSLPFIPVVVWLMSTTITLDFPGFVLLSGLIAMLVFFDALVVGVLLNARYQAVKAAKRA